MFENIIDNFIYPIIVTDNEGIIFINKLAKVLYDISHMKATDKIKKILNDIQLKEVLVNEEHYKLNTFKLDQYKISIMIPNIDNDLQMKVDMYEEIMNNINQGIFISDTDDNLIFANKSALEIESINDSISKNIKRGSLYDNFLNDLSPCEYVLKTKKALCNYKAEYDMTNGEHITVISNNYPYYYKNNFKAVYSIYQDVNLINRNLAYNSKLLSEFIKHSNLEKDSCLDSIIGKNEKFVFTKRLAMKASKSTSNIMLYGETGTGKELFANAIHQESMFSNEPFVAINCAAVPENLMESIFFGTVKGAYTGAIDSQGVFEQAKNGTIFLDEINSMNIVLQAKLLRALQEKKITRLGDNKQIEINCRIISSINKDPMQCIENNELRDDLYYRLSTFVLEIPSLKERRDDILVLINYFIENFNQKFNYRIKGISEDLLKLLNNYDFPGNVRELRHIIESTYISAEFDTKIITKDLLPRYLVKKLQNNNYILNESKVLDPHKSINEINNNLEKNLIQVVLQENNYHITNSAKQLGISRQSLQYRIKKYNLKDLINNK